MNYSALNKQLDFSVAIRWLRGDTRDDFFRDSLDHVDTTSQPDAYLSRCQHHLQHYHRLSFERYDVPKSKFTYREALSLKVPSRLFYLALAHRLIPALSTNLSESCYSYNFRDHTDIIEGDYPFNTRSGISQWKDFENDFRAAALDPDTKILIKTDIASYYDHIHVSELVSTLDSILPPDERPSCSAAMAALEIFLMHSSNNGVGIPQNYDPSSFFCSAFLTPVDIAMRHQRCRYFRYVDDMRITASSVREAQDALQELHRILRSMRLFLSDAKTSIIDKDVDEEHFMHLFDVSDDILLDKAEMATRKGDESMTRHSLTELKGRLEHHFSSPHASSKKFRAILSKLVNISRYDQFHDDITNYLKDFMLDKLRTHPERTMEWVKALSPSVDQDVQRSIVRLLRDQSRQITGWQTYWLLELIIRSPELYEGELIDIAKKVAKEDECSFARGRALVLLGKFLGTHELETLFTDYYKPNASIEVKRSLAIALQRMAPTRRDYHYEGMHKNDVELCELLDYLRGLDIPMYTSYSFETIKFPEARDIVTPARRGIGLVGGQTERYVLSFVDYDYDD